MAKRVLIICYYWPPAGGPGVQRWLKFVTYLRDFGVEPVVYVPENPHYPLTDDSFDTEVPQGIEVIRSPINEPYKFAKKLSKKKTKSISSGIISSKKQTALEKLMLFVRGNFFIPDARVGWVKPSVLFLKNYLKNNPVDAIITTGPPHSLHLIGLKLKEDLGQKWIADFRDPWTTIHYHKEMRLTKRSAAKHKALEKEVLNNADQIIVTSKTTSEEFKAITQKPISVITNGYEPSNIVSKLDAKFTLVHVGSLLSQRNPEVLWWALETLIKEEPGFKNDFKLKLVGAVSPEIEKTLKSYGLNEYVDLVGYVSHQEAIQYQHNAQVLLLIEMDRPDTRAIIPGKLFEYMSAKRPIIALGPEGSVIAGLLEGTKSGDYFTYANHDALLTTIKKLYSDFKEGSLTISSEGIEQYSRKALTEKLARLIKAV